MVEDGAEGPGDPVMKGKEMTDALKTYSFGQTADERMRMTLELIALKEGDLSPENLAKSVLVEIGFWKDTDLANPCASGKDADVEAVVRKAVEDFKNALWKIPNFGDRINKETRSALFAAHSIVLNIPALIDAALAKNGGGNG
jgi:hypothetical protein